MDGLVSTVAVGGTGGVNIADVQSSNPTLTLAQFVSKSALNLNRAVQGSESFAALRKLAIAVDPTLLNATSDLDLAIRLRDHLYQRSAARPPHAAVVRSRSIPPLRRFDPDAQHSPPMFWGNDVISGSLYCVRSNIS